jgi:hypothetical protein
MFKNKEKKVLLMNPLLFFFDFLSFFSFLSVQNDYESKPGTGGDSSLLHDGSNKTMQPSDFEILMYGFSTCQKYICMQREVEKNGSMLAVLGHNFVFDKILEI